MPQTLLYPVMRRMSPTKAVWTVRYHLLMQLVQNVLLLCLKLVLQVHLFRVHLVALKVELRQLQCKATSVHMIHMIFSSAAVLQTSMTHASCPHGKIILHEAEYRTNCTGL